MDTDALKLRRIAERALRDGGAVPLALLLELLVPVRDLRDLARRFGISPKGFRVERAPARTLAPLLAELRDAAQLDEVVALLLTARRASPDDGDDEEVDDAAVAAVPAPAADPVTALREQEVVQLRAELERARASVVRAQERESELRQRADRDAELVQVLRGELGRLRRPATAPADAEVGDRELQNRVHDLAQEIAARDAADEALRRQLAIEHTRTRELEQEIVELEALVPQRRRRKAPVEPPPLPPHRVLLPYFAPSFYRSLDGKDRRAVERAMQAILLFCIEGHAYPGLDVKQLGGQDLWSLRASLGLRLYFRHRDDGDVEIIELADREEQRTTLRRLKER